MPGVGRHRAPPTSTPRSAALAIGWGIAAALHLAFGSPAGRPTRAHIERALDELGAPVTGRSRSPPHQPRGSSVATARLADGRAVAVRVYGRDAADTQLVAKLWRSLAYKDSGPTWTVTRLQQVEHEALCLLRGARRRRRGRPRSWPPASRDRRRHCSAHDRPAGVALRALPGRRDARRGRRRSGPRRRGCGTARIAHGALDADHVVVDVDRDTDPAGR